MVGVHFIQDCSRRSDASIEGGVVDILLQLVFVHLNQVINENGEQEGTKD